MGSSFSRSRSNQGKSQKSKVAGAGHVPSYPATRTTFKWRIDGFSSLLEKDEGWTDSRVVEIMGLKWYLKLNPRDRKGGDKNEYVSLRLKLCESSMKSDTVAEASFKFLIYDQSYGKDFNQEVSHNFQTANTSSGISCMIPLRTLNSPQDSLRWNNTLNDPEFYTWDIQDFFALKSPGFSPEFEIGGHRWVICIYPSGFDNNENYLSLYLKMNMPDTVHKNSGKLIEYSISIRDQETGNQWKLTGRDTFSKNDNRCGWGKFISLETFKDGYLVKTKCCIEAHFATIGSSKTE